MKTGSNDVFTSVNLLDKNITSYNVTVKSKGTFSEDSVRITHLYLKENLIVSNLEDYRYLKAEYKVDNDPALETNKFISDEEKKKGYQNEEENIMCGRFPHLTYCGCKYPCSITLNRIKPILAIDHIYTGPIECAFKTKELLSLKITHILNVSCTEYNKRTKYFKYLDIFINDNHTENAIKFFKITNR